MKKKKVSIIASSVAAIAVCSSMVVGSTFALFTSEDTVNIAVTSGNVSITASVEQGESSSTLGGGALGGFTNTENGIALNNIAPGDEYNFTIKAENNSSISVKYRTRIEFTNALLASALDVTLGGVTYSGLTKFSTAWEAVTGEIDDLEVKVAFPASEKSQNKFQNLKTDILVTVEGIQGNAETVDDGQVVFSASTGDRLDKAVETAKLIEKKATINLVDDIALSEELYIDRLAADLTINGNGHKITAAENFAKNLQGQLQLVKINDAEMVDGKQQINLNDNTVITLENIILEHKSLIDADIYYHTLDIYGAKNVVLNNVTLIRDFDSVKGGAALVVNASNVTATDLHIVAGGSAWGGVNVDATAGEAVLTLESGFSFVDNINNLAVWLEHDGCVVDVEDVLIPINEEETAFTVVDAKVGDVSFTDFDEAIEALKSQENVTFTLHRDVATNKKLNGLKNVEIDANGCEIVFTEKGVASLGGENVIVRNAVFTNKSAPWGICGDGVSFYNCTFDGISPYIDGEKAVVIDGCTFINTYLQFGERYDFSNVKVTNNTFNVNNTDEKAHAIVFNQSVRFEEEDTAKNFWENGAAGLVVEGNTFNSVYSSRYIAYYVTVGGVVLESVPLYTNNIYNGEAYYSINSTEVENQIKII